MLLIDYQFIALAYNGNIKSGTNTFGLICMAEMFARQATIVHTRKPTLIQCVDYELPGNIIITSPNITQRSNNVIHRSKHFRLSSL